MTRDRLGAFTATALVATLILMLLFENTITRILGVLSMLAFIVAGVFLIASPEFIERERE